MASPRALCCLWALTALLGCTLFFISVPAKVICPLSVDRRLCKREWRMGTAAIAPNPQEGELQADATLYQGDMILTDEQQGDLMPELTSDTLPTGSSKDGTNHRAKRATIGRQGNRRGRLWTDGVVHYVFTPWILGFSNSYKKIVKRAMTFLQENSCLRFVELDFQRYRYHSGILFISHISGSGCSSGVGYSYGIRMNLGTGCMRQYDNSVVHELMHAIGFWHEQSRMDRDEFVVYRPENVIPGLEFNFNKEPGADNLNTEYDLNSIMHYKGYEFKKPGAPPILVPKRRGIRLGQTYAPSLMDMFQINRLYQCNAHLGLGKGLECHGCMLTVTVIATTSSTSGSITRPIFMEFVIKRAKNYVHRLLIMSTRSQSGRAYLQGRIDLWEFPVTNCIKASDIEMVSLRGTSTQQWKFDRLSLYGKTQKGVSVLLGKVENTSVRTGTEQESLRILDKVPRSSCQTCKAQCVTSLSIFLQHQRQRDTPSHIRYSLIVGWQREGQPKNTSRLDLSRFRLNWYSSFVNQEQTLPMNHTTSCLSPSTLQYAYLVPFDEAGKVIYSGRSTVLSRASVVARLENGEKFVMAELVKPASSVAPNVRSLDTRKCPACATCQTSDDS